MHSVSLIFPHQLFKKHPSIIKERPVYLVEEWLFFNQYTFHKKKLTLHRASMQCYAGYLKNNGVDVTYIEATDALCDIRKLVPALAQQGIKIIHYAHVADDWLEKRLDKACAENGVGLAEYRSPNWLNSAEDVADYFDGRKTYFQTDFYIDQRKKRNILLEANGKPIGGKWTYDSENRLRFPKNAAVPLLNVPAKNKYVADAIEWVNKHYPNNYGNTASPFGNLGGFYPVNFKEAEQWLDDFLMERFGNFGIYEDAMVAGESFLYHSVLTPMLNIGLLNPQQVIERALEMAIEHDVPLNSLEGFIRQVMGWREFIHIVFFRL
jgi:deoxyribodipyrimidine photolyase-related protein